MANLTRYSPFDEAFDDLFKGFFVRPVAFDEKTQPKVNIRMDVTENDKAYVVHADVPGVKKEDIHVTIDGNQAAASIAQVHKAQVADGPGKTKAVAVKILRPGIEAAFARDLELFYDLAALAERTQVPQPAAHRAVVDAADASANTTAPGPDTFDQAIARGRAYAPYADLVWCETSTPTSEPVRGSTPSNESPSIRMSSGCVTM